MAKKTTTTTKIESIRHKNKRTNIPTEELRDFVADEEHAPKTMLYPRDPSLDPQLVWKGKDEQDAEDLAVPVAPIYIQEKIHPQAIIDALPRIEQAEDSQFNLFADFNGGPAAFDQKVEFYHHEQNWTNRLVLGDSLMVMTSLVEKEGLKGKVQTIYLDPPYGIKFGSNWQVSTRKRDVKDGKAEDATRQPEQIRAFRDTWKLGIHSYLGYLRDRLMVARELLTETGSVFVQINSENCHLVRSLLDEVYGSENFVADIIFRKKSIPLGAKFIETMHDHILFYAKDTTQLKFRHLYEENDVSQVSSHGPYAMYPDGSTEKIPVTDFKSPSHPDGTRYYRLFTLIAPSYSANTAFSFEFQGRTYPPPSGGSWVVDKNKLQILSNLGRLQDEGKSLSYRLFYDDFPYKKRTSTWGDAPTSYQKTYVVQTVSEVIERCLLMTTDPGDLVLDPTCGSGTTAYVAEQWGRRWITCDTSRVALALARTRLMAAKYPYYKLVDSEQCSVGSKKPNTDHRSLTTDHQPLATGHYPDIKKGFIYKRVPHVTLKSIANNPDIKEGMTREQIDVAIAKHADTETLFDQPYEDNKRVRVCGPFSVESLSPHRTVDRGQCSVDSKTGHRPLTTDHYSDFATMILDNLKKAGVQNTRKGERLTFDRLDPYAGVWLHAAGEYTETSPSPAPTLPSPVKGEGVKKRVAVSIGPEHGTVGPSQVKEAAKEAVQGVGFDLLIVCGFAFDPHVAEEVKRYGKLTVLPAKMNPDLAMGDELLKKTGAGNLFMVFGEPDVEVVSEQWIVDRNGRRMVNHEQFKIISGIDSLAEISGLGREDIPGNTELTKGGNLRADRTNAKGGGFDSLEYRRRAIEELHRRISAVSGHQQGKSGRTGDTNRSGRKTEVSDVSATGESSAGVHGNRQDAERIDAVAILKNLTPDHLPLTTDHCITAEIKGLDVYDPCTGQIRNSSTDDIACWFIDTDYNGESFFVRHAYFTGADEPYDKLKRALKAEIDEAAWSSLYSTKSRAFDKPKTGKIAVKVINHYGDEVLKVFEIS